MEKETKVETVTPPVAAEPVVEVPEVKTESEDSFIDETLGETTPVEEPVEPVKEEEPKEVVETKTPEPIEEPQKETPVETPIGTPIEKVETPKVEEPKVSRIDRRLAQKYREHISLKGEESVSDESIEAELRTMSIDEKKVALRNILSEIGALRGTKVDTLAPEDEEAMIEAEVEKRMAIQQREVYEREFQDDLVKTLANHSELDNRTSNYNPKIETAVSKIVESGVLPSEAFKIVSEAVESAKEATRKATELDKQKAMSGAVLAPSNQDVINKEPETDEERFLRDALG